MDLNTVLFLGKPGSGKGTQASLLSEKTNWPIVVSGDLFRALAKEDSFIGRKTKEENDAGLLAPDWWATYFFQRSILNTPQEAGVIFEGFGRKVPEAKTVLDVLSWLERRFKAVHIKVSDEHVTERIVKRREIAGRADDNTIPTRLEEYRKFTEPSIDVFREAGVLAEIDGEGTVEEVHARVLEALGMK